MTHKTGGKKRGLWVVGVVGHLGSKFEVSPEYLLLRTILINY